MKKIVLTIIFILFISIIACSQVKKHVYSKISEINKMELYSTSFSDSVGSNDIYIKYNVVYHYTTNHFDKKEIRKIVVDIDNSVDQIQEIYYIYDYKLIYCFVREFEYNQQTSDFEFFIDGNKMKFYFDGIKFGKKKDDPIIYGILKHDIELYKRHF
jgi:hypothetical protein